MKRPSQRKIIFELDDNWHTRAHKDVESHSAAALGQLMYSSEEHLQCVATELMHAYMGQSDYGMYNL